MSLILCVFCGCIVVCLRVIFVLQKFYFSASHIEDWFGSEEDWAVDVEVRRDNARGELREAR